MKLDEVYTLMRDSNKPSVRVFDAYKNCIWEEQSGDVDSTIRKMKDREEIFKTYGKLYICANETLTNNMKPGYGCMTWYVDYGTNAAPVRTGASGNNDMPTWRDMMAIQQANFDKQLELMKLQMSIDQKKNEDPVSKFLDRNNDFVVAGMMRLFGMQAPQGGPANIAGNVNNGTMQRKRLNITFADLKALGTNAAKEQKIRELWEGIGESIGREELLIMLALFYRDPDTFIRFCNYLYTNPQDVPTLTAILDSKQPRT